MKIPTITINAAVAKNELQVIRNHRHAREYAAAQEAYKWASAGFDLIDLSEVFADAPLDEEGRPRLAVARADWKEVQLWRFDQRFTFSRWPKQRSLFRRPPSYTFRTNQYVMSGLAYALAPIIPPIYRPQGRLKEYHILWEVEAWSNTPAGVA